MIHGERIAIGVLFLNFRLVVAARALLLSQTSNRYPCLLVDTETHILEYAAADDGADDGTYSAFVDWFS